MNIESLEVKARLIEIMTNAALDLAENGTDNSIEDSMFSIDEDLELLKVLEGQNSLAYISMDKCNTLLKTRLSTIKENASVHI